MTNDLTRRMGKWAKNTQGVRDNWPYLALLLIIVLPLLLLAIWLIIGTFRGNGDNGTELRNLFLPLVTGGLATAATVFGALLTRGHNQRAERRLQLEAVVKDLEYLPEGKARIAGAISTMVQLGEQSVAMRILEPAWCEHEVDDATATWLIGQVLCGARKDETAINEAATLLREHADELTDATHRGYFNFPGYFQHRWCADLPVGAKHDVLLAMAETLISQQLSWWPSHPPRWPARVWTKCALEDDDAGTALSAAILLGALYDAFPRQISKLLKPDQVDPINSLRSDAAGSPMVSQGARRMVARLESWARADSSLVNSPQPQTPVAPPATRPLAEAPQ